eukprot:864761-Pyramimonas_sp.AAC.1
MPRYRGRIGTDSHHPSSTDRMLVGKRMPAAGEICAPMGRDVCSGRERERERERDIESKERLNERDIKKARERESERKTKILNNRKKRAETVEAAEKIAIQ